MNILANWKTTLAGLAAIFTALGTMLMHFSNGTISSTDMQGFIAAMIMGVGLIVAKDANK